MENKKAVILGEELQRDLLIRAGFLLAFTPQMTIKFIKFFVLHLLFAPVFASIAFGCPNANFWENPPGHLAGKTGPFRPDKITAISIKRVGKFSKITKGNCIKSRKIL